MNRRKLLIGGAAATATALTGLGYRAWDRGVFSSGEGEAYEAWDQWQGKPGEMPTRRVIHSAILAANAHNTQPWLFELDDETLTIHADLSRNTGAADPFRRELFTSIGCAWANVDIAQIGYSFDLTDPPTHARLETLHGNTTTAAVKLLFRKIDIAGQHIPTDLTAMRNAIPQRHTHRGPYMPDRRPQGIAGIGYRSEAEINLVMISGSRAKAELGALIVSATERFIADRDMSADSAKWFRTGRREIERHRDGISTDTAGLTPLMNGLAKLMPDQDVETADQYWLKSTREVQLPTAAAFGIIFCRDRLEIVQAMLAGARWQRTHLLLTAAGLAAQPLNQPIEMMDRDHLKGRKNDYAKELRRLAGVTEGDPAFIFRLGYAEQPALPSPRRRFDDAVLRKRYA